MKVDKRAFYRSKSSKNKLIEITYDLYRNLDLSRLRSSLSINLSKRKLISKRCLRNPDFSTTYSLRTAFASICHSQSIRLGPQSTNSWLKHTIDFWRDNRSRSKMVKKSRGAGANCLLLVTLFLLTVCPS